MMMSEDQRQPGPDDMRDAVLRFLAKHDVSPDVAQRSLRHCMDFLRDVERVRRVAAEIGLELSGFRYGDALALYFDVAYKGRDVGFIYRGWDDPGFGVGETLPIVPQNLAVFLAQAEEALRMLAASGLGVTTEPMAGGGCRLDMTSVIYSDGFNAGVLAATLQTVSESAAKIRGLVA